MKVEGPHKPSGVKGASKTGAKKDGADGAFGALLDETGGADSSVPVARTASVGVLDALLALQGADSALSEEAAKKAKKRATDLLDQLDKIRAGLLSGELPQSTLQQLAQIIASHREKAVDPGLAEILDEIDLRAQVELAKLGR
ncbi:MAG: flagellar assembly protein FliX [Alphaproteobacteria bacterium]|nr:flagellar assembly protein FliX [Alphaproteobacteria bacterium]